MATITKRTTRTRSAKCASVTEDDDCVVVSSKPARQPSKKNSDPISISGTTSPRKVAAPTKKRVSASRACLDCGSSLSGEPKWKTRCLDCHRVFVAGGSGGSGQSTFNGSSPTGPANKKRRVEEGKPHDCADCGSSLDGEPLWKTRCVECFSKFSKASAASIDVFNRQCIDCHCYIDSEEPAWVKRCESCWQQKNRGRKCKGCKCNMDGLPRWQKECLKCYFGEDYNPYVGEMFPYN